MARVVGEEVAAAADEAGTEETEDGVETLVATLDEAGATTLEAADVAALEDATDEAATVEAAPEATAELAEPEEGLFSVQMCRVRVTSLGQSVCMPLGLVGSEKALLLLGLQVVVSLDSNSQE